MAWYPGATKYELQPESDAQPAIRPTQFILHSIAAPWTARRIYEYWRESTNLESHFGLGYEGDLGQYIGTETRADANYRANLRPDGTGAVSIETASNLQHTDPWTDRQVEKLIALGAWLHERHGIPLRVCRSAADPGYGYHRLHADWAVSGTACPGDARVRQFKNLVFPGIVARATGQSPAPPQEDLDMPSMLNESNAVDVALRSGVWTGLAFTDAVLHSGPRRHSTLVHLLFADNTHKDARIEGRFYLTDTAGKNPSPYLTVTGEGPGGHQFLCSADVPKGRHLRFEVRVTTPDGSAVRLLHRVATGPYWAL
ncbi:N-acetylmuramoyl-L-alanine amidase [Streptomyces sp. NBC_01619]|uniref:peptidoglycan recognition protein family protein n=1 Tax=unclassified Streptomyces TaxID=2593676 RepID=UPI0022592776|nr:MULTISPECIES: N-acetylmuramoyl-L-alanine amidase [unclassified Streptomyces]MCX4510592.1 N-acetylmuramoyl-L-alanine amidase [Streptomyces sp. NBC_01619]